MAKGNVFDKVRNLRDKSRRAIEAAEKGEGSYLHPSSSKSGRRTPPKATSMAPREGNKRKSYGRSVPETAAEERARKKKNKK